MQFSNVISFSFQVCPPTSEYPRVLAENDEEADEAKADKTSKKIDLSVFSSSSELVCSKISLITKSKIRYEGILYSLDYQGFILSLSKGKFQTQNLKVL